MSQEIKKNAKINFMNEQDFITDFDDDGNLILIEYHGQEKIVNVPEGIFAFVEDENLFSENQFVEQVILPESLVYLASYSFYNCSNLKTVVLPNGLREINMGAFENCSALENINFPNRLKRIGPDAFKSCSKLKNPEISSKLIEIQNSSFDDTVAVLSKNPNYEIDGNVMYNKLVQASLFCTNKEISELRIRKGTKTIAWNAFAFCKNLKTVSFPNGLKEIGRAAFMCCEKIEELRFPAGLVNIESSAFANCNKLSFVKFKGSDSVKIGNFAFADCDDLKEITLPKASSFEEDSFETFCKVNLFK